MRIELKAQFLQEADILDATIKEINYQLTEEQYKMSVAQIELWEKRKHNLRHARAKILRTIVRL